MGSFSNFDLVNASVSRTVGFWIGCGFIVLEKSGGEQCTPEVDSCGFSFPWTLNSFLSLGHYVRSLFSWSILPQYLYSSLKLQCKRQRPSLITISQKRHPSMSAVHGLLSIHLRLTLVYSLYSPPPKQNVNSIKTKIIYSYNPEPR